MKAIASPGRRMFRWTCSLGILAACIGSFMALRGPESWPLQKGPSILLALCGAGALWDLSERSSARNWIRVGALAWMISMVSILLGYMLLGGLTALSAISLTGIGSALEFHRSFSRRAA
jgi:hypothetical protein